MLSNVLGPFLVINEYDVAAHHEYMHSDVGRVNSYDCEYMLSDVGRVKFMTANICSLMLVVLSV